MKMILILFIKANKNNIWHGLDIWLYSHSNQPIFYIRKLTTIILFLFLISTSYTDGVYPKPLYYEVDFNDGVTHLWSRAVYDDYHGIVKQTFEEVTMKYFLMNEKDIEYNAICISYEESREKRKAKMDSLISIYSK